MKSWGGTYYQISGAEYKGDVVIESGNKAMSINIGNNHHGGDFKTYTLNLHSSGWTFYGGAISADEILNNITKFSIRSEYGAGDDWSIIRDISVY